MRVRVRIAQVVESDVFLGVAALAAYPGKMVSEIVGFRAIVMEVVPVAAMAELESGLGVGVGRRRLQFLKVPCMKQTTFPKQDSGASTSLPPPMPIQPSTL